MNTTGSEGIFPSFPGFRGKSMKITVLMGSPKGEESVILQYVIFLRKQFPQHEFVIHDCASVIRRIEDNEASFRRIIKDVWSAEIIMWAFPLYYMAVCSQYMRRADGPCTSSGRSTNRRGGKRKSCSMRSPAVREPDSSFFPNRAPGDRETFFIVN